jgi:LPPG:FO 2-phospho-L-lactate transferase
MTTGMRTGRVVALCGGIGGAKLALGLDRILDPGQLTVVVNTGDDFEHLGLHVSPDLDTVLYTLGGIADPERGWGRANETWNFMEALRRFGGETWFQLGDRDLAMHVSRTDWLRCGRLPSEFVSRTAHSLGISAQILPMSDNAVRTIVETAEGDLPFQHYFVRRRCEPVVKGIRFEGASAATPSPGVLELLLNPAVRAIVVCPSNPYLSVDPILSVPGMRDALANGAAPVIAVSPIIGGQAVKGPTAKIMHELGFAVNTQAIAAHYRGLIDAMVIDEADAADEATADVPAMVTKTMMKNLSDRERLASDVVAFADKLALRQSTVRAAGGGR